MSIEIGIHGGQQDVSIDELRRMWKFADRSGFDFISLWDHFYEAPPVDGNAPVFEAIAAMATLASDTVNAKIGCHVLCVTYRNPGLLANSIMTIDHVSHGRVEVGLGAGWQIPEHLAYGFPFDSPKERSDRLEEGIEVLRMLFSQNVSNFDGNYYQLRDAKLNPRPVQERIPIVVGGRGKRRTLPTAARLADGWNVPYVTVEEFTRLNVFLDEICQIENRDPANLHRSVNLHMRMGTSAKHAVQIQSERGLAEGVVGGTCQEAIETIKAYEQAGADRVSIAIRPPIEWESLQAFAEEVIPAIK